jgi:PAS domain S-box-containing protein
VLFRNTNKRSFFAKILLPTFLAIGLFVASFFLIIIPRFEETILDRKREMIKELTNSAWSIFDECYRMEANKSLPQEQAQQLAIEQVRNLRYGEERKDYFWITDMYPTMIMHPYRKDLDRHDLTNFKDSHGKKLFVEIVKVIKLKGEGFVDYQWQWKDDSTRIVPKLSYVKEFKPWGWIIGTGIYIEDVKQEISSLEKNLIKISIGIIVVISLLLFFITIQNLKAEQKRKQAEDELRESKEKYRTLVEASTEGLIMILEGKQIYYNKTFLAMLGYAENNIPELSLKEIFEDNLFNGELNRFKFLKKGEPQNIQIETKMKKNNGEYLDVMLISSPISFMDNEGTVLIVKDMSLHKKIEEALDESKEKYAALTNQLTIGVFRTTASKEAKFIEVNPAIINILRTESKEDTCNYSLVDFFDDAEEGRTILKQAISSGVIKNRIVQLRKKNGEKAVVSLSIILIKDEKDSVLYYDGIIEDITEHNKTDENRESLISDLQTSLLFLNQPIKPYIKDFGSCNLNSTINYAVRQMLKTKLDAVLITSDADKYVGIVTEKDLRERVLADNKDLTSPLFAIMTSPLVFVKQSATIFEAMMLFYEKKINHLVVRNGEDGVCGILLDDDMKEAYHSTYLFFINRIQKTTDTDEITKCYQKLNMLIKAVIDSGAGVYSITRIITIISDTIAKRLVEIAIEDIGPPPVEFVFMALGSEGREEQTLVTDQDNALVYEDVNEEKQEETHKYFLRLGEIICNNLNSVGYKFCKGNVMAKNPKWCQPISEWKKYFTDWVTTANPQNLLDVNIFFDFRPVYGNEKLTEQLKNHLRHITAGYNSFFVYLAQNALQFKSPANLFKAGELFDIKLTLLPIVDMIRVYALKNKIYTGNTTERINQLYEKNIFSRTSSNELLHIYNFLMQVRFKHQSKMFSENLPSDNNINPKLLTELEQTIFKKIFTQIENFQSKLSLDFKGTL